MWSISFSNGQRILHFRCFVSFVGQGLPYFVGCTLKCKLEKLCKICKLFCKWCSILHCYIRCKYVIEHSFPCSFEQLKYFSVRKKNRIYLTCLIGIIALLWLRFRSITAYAICYTLYLSYNYKCLKLQDTWR